MFSENLNHYFYSNNDFKTYKQNICNNEKKKIKHTRGRKSRKFIHVQISETIFKCKTKNKGSDLWHSGFLYGAALWDLESAKVVKLIWYTRRERINSFVYTYAHTNAYVHVRFDTRTCINIYTYTQTCIPTRTYTRLQVFTHKCLQTPTYAYTIHASTVNTHTYTIIAFTDTHIHT